MPNHLSDEDIEKIAEAIAKKRGVFYVEPEIHYQQHQRLDKFLDLYDSTSSIVLRFFLGLFLVGIVTIIGYGFFGLQK